MIVSAIILILAIYLIALLIRNVQMLINIDWNSVSSINELLDRLHFTLDVSPMFSSLKSIGLILLIAAALVAVVLIAAASTTTSDGKRRRSIFKTKYERENYNHFMRKFERKRGTTRIQYTDDGKITRKTLEVFFENLISPIVKLQNNYCDEYLLPAPKKWNSHRKFKIGDNVQFHASGVPVIAHKKYFLFGKYNRVYYLGGNIHNMFIGMTGKGKSWTFVLPMLYSAIYAGEGIVAHDPKKELYAYCKPLLEEMGYQTIILNFDEPEKGDCWNPLTYPYNEWKKALEEAYELAQTVAEENGLPIPADIDYRDVNMSVAVEQILDICNTICFEEDAKTPTWWQGASAMMAGGAQLLFEEGIDEYVNFKSIRYIYQIGNDHQVGRETTIAKYLAKHRPIDAGSGEKMSTYLDSEGVTKASYQSVFQNKINLLTATENIINMTSRSTFNIKDVFNKKVAIFLMTQDEKTTYYPLVTMFFKQLYEAGIKVTKENPKEKKLEVPMNWYIDEFGLLPEIKDIEAIYAAARSRGVRINTWIQSPSQLRDKYENETAATILDNCTNIIYLGSGTDEVKDYFVRRVGTEIYYDKLKGDYVERPLLTSNKLNLMEKGRSLFTTVEWNPYISKLPPFDRYTFYREPDWTLEKRKLDRVEFFNIKEHLDKKRHDNYRRRNIKTAGFNTLSNRSSSDEDLPEVKI